MSASDRGIHGGMDDIQELNERYALGQALQFDRGEGGLTRVRVATESATAEIYLQGAHVTLWQPADAGHPCLFLSEKSHFAPGKPIRGGVPLVFPWFADRTDGLPGPAHGFARTMIWEVVATEQRADGIAISFRLLPDQTTRDLGYDHFVLIYEVVVGPTLTLALEVNNLADRPLTIEEAMHAYFAVSDIHQAEVTGLGGTDYLDRADSAARKHQEAGTIRFRGETDQLHLGTGAAITIADPGWQRRIMIEKQGSSSTVVWNPWQTKASKLSDLGGDAWTGMVCVEPANAAGNAVVLAPGTTHDMRMTVRQEVLR